MTMTFAQFCELERSLAHANRLRYAKHYELGYETLSSDGVAIAGADGWLFIGDGSNHWEGQFTGEFHLTESGLADWMKAFERRHYVSQLIGAQFVHLVIPEKQSVLTKARWVNDVKIQSQRPILQLVQALSVGESRLIYSASMLARESYYAELYFRGDSHCCVSGTWLYFLDVAKHIWSNKQFDFALVPLQRSWRKQDLLAKYAHNIYEEIIVIARHAQVVFDNQLAKHTGAQVGNHYILHNEQALYNETVIIYGDSYSFDMGFSDVVSVFFQKVHFIWGTVVDFNYCKQHAANYVIVQSAERFLARVHDQDIFNAE